MEKEKYIAVWNSKGQISKLIVRKGTQKLTMIFKAARLKGLIYENETEAYLFGAYPPECIDNKDTYAYLGGIDYAINTYELFNFDYVVKAIEKLKKDKSLKKVKG